MANDHDFPRDDAERSWLAALPQASAPPPVVEERLVAALRQEGYLSPRRRIIAPLAGLAAAAALFVTGGLLGAHLARRDALESRVMRTNLSAEERILLLQRAGSVYLRSMQQVAAIAPRDPMAAEVATQALTATAHAAARMRLDGGLSLQLVSLLEPRRDGNATPPSTLTWY